jgi:hypothetical protein
MCSSQIVTKLETENQENTDQSGIELELHSIWTLSHKDEKITVAVVPSTNINIRSYTVLNGHFLSFHFCLKEPKKHMSENMRSHMFYASVSCLLIKINSLTKFVGWFNKLSTLVAIRTPIQGFSKLWLTCVSRSTLRCALLRSVIRLCQ